jgi:hypothetical protein
VNSGKTIFSQLMDFITKPYFDKLVRQFKGNYRMRTFSCWDQFLSMAFAQLTYRESLRDIEACLNSVPNKLYHMGIKGNVSKSNLSRANEARDYRIFENLAHKLIHHALSLYNKDELIFNDLNNALYAFDSTVVDLCLALFPWAQHRKNKSAIRINTLLEIRTSLPTFINISSGGVHEINSLDLIPVESLAIYIMDKGFIDFERFFNINSLGAFFITREKKNSAYRRIYSSDVSAYENIICDQVIKMSGPKTHYLYPEKLRRIKYYDKINDKRLIFLTNNFSLSPSIVAILYKERWKIELFFKWIKQHLKIKSFYGRNENAMKSQIWIAISIYVLIIIIKKKLNLDQNIYTILQILSVNVLSKILLKELFINQTNLFTIEPTNNQLLLFDIGMGQ